MAPPPAPAIAAKPPAGPVVARPPLSGTEVKPPLAAPGMARPAVPGSSSGAEVRPPAASAGVVAAALPHSPGLKRLHRLRRQVLPSLWSQPPARRSSRGRRACNACCPGSAGPRTATGDHAPDRATPGVHGPAATTGYSAGSNAFQRSPATGRGHPKRTAHLRPWPARRWSKWPRRRIGIPTPDTRRTRRCAPAHAPHPYPTRWSSRPRRTSWFRRPTARFRCSPWFWRTPAWCRWCRWPDTASRRSSAAAKSRSAATSWTPAISEDQGRPNEGLCATASFRRSAGSSGAGADHPHHHGDRRHQRKRSGGEAGRTRQRPDRIALDARRIRHRQPVARR